ncbi:putative integral membrane protein [Neofusicoccum parvum UCRNP2]|uniref:Putative integral membrane protein n=1 Tax=Botryosphaeria parva (strain UCR-NP2) TaxID=1287680 RepID=R1GKN9_BOTPV|nr:putative integral membrane protein [Neofusicoccum parvum UCRNP2]
MSQAESAARQSVLICSIVCTVVVVAITAIRLYTRILLVMGLGSDDYSLVFAVAGWFAMMALFVVAPKYGLGTHLADVDPSKQDMFIRVMIAAGTLYNTVMLACKLSILLLYRRLFPIQNFTKRWWCVAIFTISYSVVVAVASAFGRTPVAAKCIIRLQSIILFLKDDDGDITFQTTKLAIWCLVETTISIVCVCAPTLRPFFRRYFGSFFSWSGSGSNSDGRNGNRLYFSSFFRSTRYGRQTSRSHNNHSLPGHSDSNFPPHLSAHHRTMIAAESLELGNPQKTDAHVEVGHVVDVEAGGMLPDYDARSTDHIIDEHKAGVIGLARDSEELGSEDEL